MLGTLINGAAILVGGAIGLATSSQIPVAIQGKLKVVLGALVVYVGLSTTWKAVNGSFGQIVKQIVVILLALVLGNLAGKLLRLQRGLNRLGEYARNRFAQAGAGDARRWSEGLVTCTLLFCVGPMAILGSMQDGLTGDFKTLAIKGAMDGLATMAFVTTFGWGVILAVVPVVAYQGTLTLLAQSLAPYLQDQALLDSVNATGGLLVLCISLIIFEAKKVALADYLPSLLFAPVLTWLWR
ncbi:MAG: DUF554 domain-containing protein [Pedosphaera parvula]|nr:DUF554 domain-containing protein [Verrucomicrobiota bacterium]MBI3191073.1 DUF554 domain-containing protein [Pedosphaera parvula]